MRRNLPLAAALVMLGCSANHPVIEDVDYDTATGSRTSMDVVVPNSASGAGAAVFLAHGGGWESGDKGDMRYLAQRLADLGYVAASVGYRLAPEGVHPKSSQDISCAWDHFIANAQVYGFDPNRVAVIGYSAGGHLVSLHATAQSLDAIASDCATPPSGIRPAAVVSSAGTQNLLDYSDDAVGFFLGGGKEEARAAWLEASPIQHVDPSDPPFLFVHGEGDLLVPLAQATKMQAALDEVGVDNRLMVIPCGGHVLNPSPGGGDPQAGSPLQSPEGFMVLVDFLSDTIGRP